MATLVNDGLERRARRMFADTCGNFQYCALGTDATAEANDQSNLIAEISTSGAARMVADTMQYVADYKAQWIAQWTITGTIGINETGIFDSSANGTMLMRHKFAAQKNVINGDTLQLTFTETESRA